MRLLVCGSRHFNDLPMLEGILDDLRPTEIIHGGARGADTLSGNYGKRRNVPVRVFPADWNKFGKRAGPIRNHQMLSEGQPEKVLAFLAPNSRGTKHMIEISQKAGIPVEIVNI